MEGSYEMALSRIVGEVSLPHRALFAATLREAMQDQRDRALKYITEKKYDDAYAANYAANCISDLMYHLTSNRVLVDTERT